MVLLTGAIIVLAITGAFFVGVAAVGLVRLPDLYTRAHAASKTDTLGAILTLSAVGIYFGVDVATAKVGFLLLFLLVTNPTAAHAIARAADDQDITPWGGEEA